MQIPDLEDINLGYETEFDNAVKTVLSDLNDKAKDFTQEKKAKAFGVSIRTIQHFERGRSRNYKLLWCYRLAAYGEDPII